MIRRSGAEAGGGLGGPKEPKKTMKSYILKPHNDFNWLIGSFFRMKYRRSYENREYCIHKGVGDRGFVWSRRAGPMAKETRRRLGGCSDAHAVGPHESSPRWSDYAEWKKLLVESKMFQCRTVFADVSYAGRFRKLFFDPAIGRKSRNRYRQAEVRRCGPDAASVVLALLRSFHFTSLPTATWAGEIALGDGPRAVVYLHRRRRRRRRRS